MGKVRDAKNKRSSEAVGKQMMRRKILLEVRQEATEFSQGLRRGMDPTDAVQMVLDNMTTTYEFASQQVMELEVDDYYVDTLTGKRLNEWIIEQERLGLQVVHVAGKAASMGLAERQIRLQESTAAIFATIVEATLVAAGIAAEQRREIHQGISAKLEDIQGTAESLPLRTAA